MLFPYHVLSAIRALHAITWHTLLVRHFGSAGGADAISSQSGPGPVSTNASVSLTLPFSSHTFSCSRAIDVKLFRQIVFAAAVDAKRQVQVIDRLGLPLDHPVSLHHPEGEYLKGLVLRVVE